MDWVMMACSFFRAQRAVEEWLVQGTEGVEALVERLSCAYTSGKPAHGPQDLPLTPEAVAYQVYSRLLGLNALRDGKPIVLEGMKERFPRISRIWVDQGYTGFGKQWIKDHLEWEVEVVQHAPKARGEWVPIGDLNDLAHICFEWHRIPPQRLGFRGVLARRWVVERTFAWISFCRRLCKDYELLPESSENWIYAALIRLMTCRLARSSP